MALALIVIVVLSAIYLANVNIPILEPKGVIADKEFRLLVTVTVLMSIVALPVFGLLIYIVWKYNEKNHTKKKYSPDWESNKFIEGTWWAIPTILIVILSVITWNATYALNPYNPIASKNSTLNVQVIALDWKWLFIYPALKVATINKLMLPVNTPVHFYLTADAPMNSFWIPQLSGQIYAMPGMQTQLYILANQPGEYNGWSANISGIGFAGMMFKADVVSATQFKDWASRTVSSAPALSLARYNSLIQPSAYVKTRFFSNPATNIFSQTIDKYMVADYHGAVQ